MRVSISYGFRELLLAALATGFLPVIGSADTICSKELPMSPTGGSTVEFGRAVAIHGGLAIVCGDLEAYAYAWSGSEWLQEAVLTIPGAESGFGASAALQDGTALIGLPLQDDAFADAGRVLVFVRDGAGAWTLEDELKPADPDLNDQFGFSVAFDGDRAVIGSPRDDSAGLDTGSAYVFERSGMTWTQVDKIVPADPAAVRFGTSVSLSNNTAVIGSGRFLGGVYVYVENAGLWVEEAELAQTLLLPSQVAVQGDRAIVGGLSNSLVFERTGSIWNETDQLSVAASTVALDGDIAILGGASCPSTPAAFVFVYDGIDWIESADLEIAGSVMPVAIDGLRTIVGTRGGLACSGGEASNFDLVLELPPSVAHRNAGTNPDSYTAVSASYGEDLQFTIDLTTTGHSMALVLGFDSPFQFILGGGQTLLCLDLMGSGGELINTGFFPGPIANISLAVPNNPIFGGFFVSTQAIHAFGVAPFALSNAQDIVIGACPGL